MGTAIRKHLKDFLAVISLVVIAGGITLYILAHQNIIAPSWVPVLGKETFTFKAQFSTAQAVTPGQGQTINVAGVPIGNVTDVQLENGRAVVSMELEPKFRDRIHPDATMLLRPKTGLKDMVIALDPGTAAGGPALRPDDVLPVSHTQPDVNFDEFLSVLDADTRDYLVLLLNGGGQGLVKNGRTLAQVLRRFDPTQRNIAKITSQLQYRQANMKRVTTSLGLLLTELGKKDTQLAAFVDSSNAVLGDFAAQESNLKKTISLLPGALEATNSAVKNVNSSSLIAGPTLEALRPSARGLTAVQVASQDFFSETISAIQTQLRPFAAASGPSSVQPALRDLAPASEDLAAAGPGLVKTGKSLNYGLNELAYDPAGDVPSYMFDLFWLGHNTSAQLINQDAAGPVRQSVFLGSKHAFSTIYNILSEVCAPAGNYLVGSPSAWATVELLRPPRPTTVPAPVCRGS
ncbi:MAG: MlaD family protein [Solirubrobacterales bacterium]|nr:MlaD family protein [Solirubrobacterales bacterium]